MAVVFSDSKMCPRCLEQHGDVVYDYMNGMYQIFCWQGGCNFKTKLYPHVFDAVEAWDTGVGLSSSEEPIDSHMEHEKMCKKAVE
tara:strand:+ start:896 stop:1150 length:255 start_codon:yes stop_codon:yes gene_type:complete